MKTKLMFMAMSLPVVFTACTSEEFEAGQNNTANLEERIPLGDVELSFGEDAYSRISASNGIFKFETGDGVGACLVDNYVKATDPKNAWDNYKLTSTIQTNYQYKFDGSTWTTTARMVEGNYVFYAPYNAAHLNRAPISISLPTTQKLALDAEGKLDQYSILNAFVKSGTPAYVGYKFLEAKNQDLKISVDMKPIFAYPLITFSNDKTGTGAGDVVITKFVVTTENPLPTKAPLNIGTANAIASKNAGGVVGNFFDLGSKAEENGAWVNNKYMLGNKTSNIIETADETVSTIIVSVPNNALTVKQGESVKFNIVLPAETGNSYTIYAYDNNGQAYILDDASLNFSAGKMYADNQYNMSSGEALNTAAGMMTVKTSTDAEPAPNIVASTDELKSLIASATTSVTGIKLANSSVKLTEDIVKAANPTLTYTFADKVAIVGGEKAYEIKNFGFTNGVEVESGAVTISATTLGATKVKEGATLNLYGAASTEVTVEKNANFVLGNGTAAIEIASLTNAGTTTINKGAKVSSPTNTGSIINNAETIPATLNGKWINNANVVLGGNKTIAENATLVNKGSITTNNKELIITGTLDNEGMIINDVSNKVTVNGKLIVRATSMYKGGKISAASGGRIDLYEGYQAANDFGVGSGTLAQVVESYDNTVDEPLDLIDGINMVSVTKSITLKSKVTDVNNIELGDAATFNLNGNITVDAATTISLVGNATIKGIYTLSSGNHADYDLTFNIPSGKTLTLSGVTIGKASSSDVTFAKTGTDTAKAKVVKTAGASIATGYTVNTDEVEVK